MKRHVITLQVSMFAHDSSDADMLANLLRDRVDQLLGQGQSIVRVANVEDGEDADWQPFGRRDEAK